MMYRVNVFLGMKSFKSVIIQMEVIEQYIGISLFRGSKLESWMKLLPVYMCYWNESSVSGAAN